MVFLYPPPRKTGYTFRQLKDMWLDGIIFIDSDDNPWTIKNPPKDDICLWCKVTNSKIKNPKSSR